MLIKCPECGRDVSDKAEKCPGCGYDLTKAFENIVICGECGTRIEGHPSTCPNCGNPLPVTHTITVSEEREPAKIGGINQKLLIAVAIALVAIIAIVFGVTGLNSDEKQALADCKDLKSSLLSPSSMVLYEVIVRPDWDEYGDMTYISFGATNSYGTIIQKVAVYQNGEFIGYFDEDNSDVMFPIKVLPYSLYKLRGVLSGENLKIINVEKLMKKLK